MIGGRFAGDLMGFNNDQARRLVFDIETAPIEDAAAYLEQPEVPANYKDPVKIAGYIAGKFREKLERCSLDIDLCRVVAIGCQLEGDEHVDANVTNEIAESDLLTLFWLVAQGRHLVGFNCLGFDLPVLLRRSQYLGVPIPLIQIDKYRHPEVTDLQQVLSFNGAIKYRSLDFYARRFGLAVEPDVLTGPEIPQAVKDGRWADIRAHVAADVKRTAGLAMKLGLLREPVCL